MLPTPSTSHVPYSRVYEPAEDSFLLLDTLSSDTEREFLRTRFPLSPRTPLSTPTNAGHDRNPTTTSTPLILEIGSGSGIVTAFLAANAGFILGREVVLAATDLNPHACAATERTVELALREADGGGEDVRGVFLGSTQADLAGPWAGQVDVLIFNPPYVPTPSSPPPPPDVDEDSDAGGQGVKPTRSSFEQDSYYLELAYAGGPDGMRTTSRLLDNLGDVLRPEGCAYILLCAQNMPEDVKARARSLGSSWRAETVGDSGRTAGWERLQIVRIWREGVAEK